MNDYEYDYLEILIIFLSICLFLVIYVNKQRENRF